MIDRLIVMSRFPTVFARTEQPGLPIVKLCDAGWNEFGRAMVPQHRRRWLAAGMASSSRRYHVTTLGRCRPVCMQMPAISSAAAIRSDRAA